jgi:hypothetical protein
VRKISGGAATSHRYGGQNILAETRRDGRSVHLRSGPSIDGSGNAACYRADGYGSIVGRTDATGVVVSTRRYVAGPVSKSVRSSPATRRQAESGTLRSARTATEPDATVRRRGRSFAGTIGSRDVMIFCGYVGNAPVMFSDPTETSDRDCYVRAR